MFSNILENIPRLFFGGRSKKGPLLWDKVVQEFLFGCLSESERNNREINLSEGPLLKPYDSSWKTSKDDQVRFTLCDQDVQEFLVGTCFSQVNPETFLLQNALSGPYDRMWEIAKDQVKIDKGCVLGKGECCRVNKAVMKWLGKDIEVAVKVPNKNCTSIELKHLLMEVKIMTYLGSHPNIVGLIGAYTRELSQGVIYVATELCSLGSLESYLRMHQSEERYYVDNGNIDENNNEVAGSMETRVHSPRTKILLKSMNNEWNAILYEWSHEIACGMEYLERKGMVHADLATRNIFLTSERTAKITNFGLTKKLSNYSDYISVAPESLPWRWMAIENFKDFEIYLMSDVWSYGVTMWEIFSSGRIPYPGLIWTDDFVDKLSNGLRPNCPPFASPEIFKVMQACWVADPEKRPSFSNLVKCTGSILQNFLD